VATITNLQQQYGIDKTYEINVNEAPIMQVSPLNLNFTAIQGGTNPPAQEVSIINKGGGTVNWVAVKDASWLSISPSLGVAPSTMNVSVNITGLPAGNYIGYIDIDGRHPRSLCCAEPCFATVRVSLLVTPPATPIPTSPAGIWTSPSAVQSKCGEEAGFPVTAFIDGNTATYWKHNVDELHWIVLDMGSVRNIKQIGIWGVSSQASRWDGVNVYVSDDTVNWGTAVGANVSIVGDNEWVYIDIVDKYGRYIRLQNIDTRMVDGSLQGYEFQALVSSSSSLIRPPGLASLGSGLAWAAPPYGLQTMGERAGILPTIGGGIPPALLSPEAVKFVIVLELKAPAP
jgi:hypothetical protein